jgi:hypothetical protein
LFSLIGVAPDFMVELGRVEGDRAFAKLKELGIDPNEL